MNLSNFMGGAAGGAVVNIIIRAVDEYSSEFKKVDSNLKEQQGDMNKLTKIFDAHRWAIGLTTTAIVGFGVASVKQALDSERATQQFNLALGDTADLMLNKLTTASKGMVSNFNLIDNANRAMALGIAKNQLPELMEVATARSKIFGRSVTDAFNDIAIGIGRQSRLILDNLGIIVDLDKTYDEYGKTIGKAGDKLTVYEQKQALTNAIIAESQGLIKSQSFLLETNNEKLQRLGASWGNLKEKVGMALLRLGDNISGVTAENQRFKDSVDSITGIEGTYDVVANSVIELENAHKNLTLELTASREETDKLIDSLLNLKDITFEGESKKGLEIANQKEIIRQLELKRLTSEDILDIIDKEKDKLDEMKLLYDKTAEANITTQAEKIRLLELEKIQKQDIGDLIADEKKKLEILRLENEKFANEKEIQQFKNKDNLIAIGELETVTFENFAGKQLEKINSILEERKEQDKLIMKITEVDTAQNNLLLTFGSVLAGKLTGYKMEEEAIDKLIGRVQTLTEEYKKAKRAQDAIINVPKAKGFIEKYLIDPMNEWAKTQGATSEWNLFGRYTGNPLQSQNVADAIIKPDGEIIRTDPNDTLIATKHGFGGTTINVHINNLNGFNARDIASMLQQELNKKISMV